MGDFIIKVSDATPCRECGSELNLDIQICPICSTHDYRVRFQDFFTDLDFLKLMDARYGGLVIGRNGPDDDIPMYAFRGDGVYSLVGLMQGGEYILSQAASAIFHTELLEINSKKGLADEINYTLSIHSSIINTQFMPEHGGLWVREGQFIINRYATAKYIDELECMNAEGNKKLAEAADGSLHISGN